MEAKGRDAEAPCGGDSVVGGVCIKESLPALQVLTALFYVTQTLQTGHYTAPFGAATGTSLDGLLQADTYIMAV